MRGNNPEGAAAAVRGRAERPEIGHLPNLESADLFNRALLDFLEAPSEARP